MNKWRWVLEDSNRFGCFFVALGIFSGKCENAGSMTELRVWFYVTKVVTTTEVHSSGTIRIYEDSILTVNEKKSIDWQWLRNLFWRKSWRFAENYGSRSFDVGVFLLRKFSTEIHQITRFFVNFQFFRSFFRLIQQRISSSSMDFHVTRTIWTVGWSRWRTKSTCNLCCSLNAPMVCASIDAWAVALDDPMTILIRWKSASTCSIRKRCQSLTITNKSIWCAVWMVRSHQSWSLMMFNRRSMITMPTKVLCDT